MFRLVVLLPLLICINSFGQLPDTLPALKEGHAQQNYAEMWAGFDPRAEPLEIEILKEWVEEGVVLRIVRFRVGVFKGQTAKLAAVYGFPKGASKLPGLVQIHGGGQYADHKACLTNGKRGYATISLAWAGRISAPEYRVSPDEVKLFWDEKIDDPNYRITTDWGAVDGYHAPGRNAGNQFPSAKAAAWTLDSVESPRNSGWFLCAVAARRALTFLEQQPEVDANRLGVYGHSMGGKLTVLTAPDDRVKAAAPSCGGISDRDNASELFRMTLGDDVSLQQINCPIMFLSPSNDFHGRIGDLPKAVEEIQSDEWRVTCSPHHNHQDTPPYEVATQLWFDQYLKGTFKVPKTPRATLNLKTEDGVPMFSVKPDSSMPVDSVEIFYTQHGQPNETSADRESVKHRFWHHAFAEEASTTEGTWTGTLPVSSIDKPLWVYANVTYELESPVEGAGYYYRVYSTKTFNLSSLLQTATPQELRAAGIKPTLKPTSQIEDFTGDWRKEWFTYRPDDWAITTNMLRDERYAAPKEAKLLLEVQSEQQNKLVILIDEYTAEVGLTGDDHPQTITLSSQDFRNLADEGLDTWNKITQLKLCAAERLKPARGDNRKARIVGGNWRGPAPKFHGLRWTVESE